MGLVKEIFMTTTQYKIDDEFVVTNSFEWDGMKFKIGQTGTIKHFSIENGDFYENDPRYFVAWDHEDQRLHDCGGFCPLYHGWCIESNKLLYNSRLVYESKATNPLPDDPRLRGIALKIIQLERKFKKSQDAKRSLANV